MRFIQPCAITFSLVFLCLATVGCQENKGYGSRRRLVLVTVSEPANIYAIDNPVWLRNGREIMAKPAQLADKEVAGQFGGDPAKPAELYLFPVTTALVAVAKSDGKAGALVCTPRNDGEHKTIDIPRDNIPRGDGAGGGGQ